MAWLYVNVQGSVFFAGIIPHLMSNVSSPRNGKLAVEGWEELAYTAAPRENLSRATPEGLPRIA